MRHTISQRAVVFGVLLLVAATARAQTSPPAADDPFARRRWHFQTAGHAASEAWNYNISHEELYGISEGVTYGLRDGLVLTLNQRVYYISQRANDTWLLGLTFGVRGRVYRRGRTSVFIEGNLGISDGAIATPPRGTRFNYLALGSGGVLVRMKPRLHLLAGLQLIHISNNGLKGPSRNPDIEAIGPALGVVIGF
jgi:Lipid A 3-O-deacylase (PagL)